MDRGWLVERLVLRIARWSSRRRLQRLIDGCAHRRDIVFAAARTGGIEALIFERQKGSPQGAVVLKIGMGGSLVPATATKENP